ncbi:MAG: DUF1996 domain-containing protein [Kineosporiaceae bacterium]
MHVPRSSLPALRRRAGLVAVAVLAAAGLAATSPASATRQAEQANFIVSCPFSHRAADDPLVHPGMAGMSHLHDFFGNTTTDAESTTTSLLAGGTTCDRTGDTAAYWMPTTYVGGKAVKALKATVYYRNVAANPADVVPFPTGFHMIAGDPTASAADPQRANYVGWACRKDSGPKAGIKGRWTSDAPTCKAGQTLVFRVRFPDCWNGVDLDSADHRSHVAYGKNGVCPKGFPVHVPRVSMTEGLDSRGGPTTALSSGSVFTGHADFINAWQPQELSRLVDECLHEGLKCGFTSDGSDL